MSTTHQARIVWGCKVAHDQQDEAEAWESRTGLEAFVVENRSDCLWILGVNVTCAEGYAAIDLADVTKAQKVFARKVGAAEGWPFGKPSLLLMTDSY